MYLSWISVYPCISMGFEEILPRISLVCRLLFSGYNTNTIGCGDTVGLGVKLTTNAFGHSLVPLRNGIAPKLFWMFVVLLAKSWFIPILKLSSWRRRDVFGLLQYFQLD